MEPSNFPVVSKKFWRFVRTALSMLKEGMIVSKTKLMLDLNLLLKRGKLAGKSAFHNLLFHSTTAGGGGGSKLPKEYYEFSCSNSPAAYPGKKGKRRNGAAAFDEILAANAVVKALEVLHAAEAPSPALPGFGRTPVVRQLRVSDSPYPIREAEEGGGQVDAAAEAFISKFYNALRRQGMEDKC
ncbi:unnamed protein product [Cuscuta campestris]|uniref:Avr9/Cf-9 rapidly elicited protein 146 n=1 Tax=Cuscuta campestris TaxID=132261 RepID=A0A484M3S7_9ASTE|nr:unnamed protein product [Cuscuta campestris]